MRLVLLGDTRKIKLHDFDSITDFNNFLIENKTNEFFRRERLASKSTNRNIWRGTNSYEEAQELFSKGWNAAAERISKHVPVQTAQHTANRTKPTYGVVGGQASVPRYLQGIPTNMIDRKIVSVKQKIIVINRDISFHAGFEPEVIEESGIKALQIAQNLENRGYRVKLNLLWSVYAGGETLSLRLCLKKPDERMSVAKMAFALAHPSMLRRVCFRWLEVNPDMTNGMFCTGYGMPDTEALVSQLPKNEYYLKNYIDSVDGWLRDNNL
jgi:hypothetical protein